MMIRTEPDEDILKALKYIEEEIEIFEDFSDDEADGDEEGSSLKRLRQLETTFRRLAREAGYAIS